MGYFENRSTLVMKYCSMPFSFLIGPPNYIWISSLGSKQIGKGGHLLNGIICFKFLPISVQVLHLLTLANIFLGIHGHQIFCAQDNIAKLPG